MMEQSKDAHFASRKEEEQPGSLGDTPQFPNFLALGPTSEKFLCLPTVPQPEDLGF